MKKNQQLMLIAYAIVFVMYVLLSALFIKEKGAAFWISYLFAVIGFVAAAGIVYKTAEEEQKDPFFGIPLILVCNIYLIIQLVLGLRLMIVAPSVKTVIIVEVIPLAVFGVLAVGALLGRNVTETLEAQTKQKIRYMQEVENALQGCINDCGDESLRKELMGLKESVHYSDPMSSDALADLEGQMLVMARQIRGQVSGSPEETRQNCRRLRQLLDERNTKCLQLK